MRRALLAVAVLSPMIAAVYACSTDTFTGGDASSEGGGVITQADFCGAEALYLHQCGYADAACAVADLKNCGAVYATITNALTTALTTCIEAGSLQCTGDFTKLVTSGCISGALVGYSNDSGVLANLANDFCAKCEPTNAACGSTFTASDQPGYVASFYTDGVIQQMDDCEKKIDAGGAATFDASACVTATLLCEYIAIGKATPGSACNDQ